MLSRWIPYALLPGLLPVVVRALAAVYTQADSVTVWVYPTDLAAFGVVILVANIATIESSDYSNEEKRLDLVTSITWLLLYCAIFALSALAEFAGDLAWKVFLIPLAANAIVAYFSLRLWRRLYDGTM